MRNVKRIAVVCADTLRAFGLRNLLVSYFAPVETDLFPAPEAVDASRYDFFFVDMAFAHPASKWPKGRVLALDDPTRPHGETLVPVLDTAAELQHVVERVGAFFHSARMGETATQYRSKTLTEREIQILREVVGGAINKEIADRLSISFNTVLTHRKNIAAKTGIKTVSGLTFYALLNGYVSPHDIEL